MEENEIDESEELVDYTPLDRPCLASQPSAIQYSDNSEPESDQDDPSSDDSDSPFRKRKKENPKVKLNNVQQEKKCDTKNKYNVWCADAQETALVDDLEHCGVQKKKYDVDLGIESYNLGPNAYRPKYKSDNFKKEFSADNNGEKPWKNKRRFGERKTFKPRKRPIDKTLGDLEVEGKSRTILGLQATAESSEEEISRDIANKLCEPKENLILKVVKVLGKETAIKVFEETRLMEENGGMLIMNRSRRRTPGGVYFTLIKKMDLSPIQLNEIFEEDEKMFVRYKKRDAAQKRQEKTRKLRATLSAENLLPTLLTCAELAVRNRKNEAKLENDERPVKMESDSEPIVSNPPPSPATDGKENSDEGDLETISEPSELPTEQRQLESYDDADDFLGLNNYDMDLF